MTETELLSAIAGGRTSFTLDAHPDLVQIDQMLKKFETSGYVIKVMRNTEYAPMAET